MKRQENSQLIKKAKEELTKIRLSELQRDWVEKEEWSWTQLTWVKQKVERVILPKNCPLPISVKRIQGGGGEGGGVIEDWEKEKRGVLEADEHREEIEWLENYDQEIRRPYQEREGKWKEITEKLMDNYERKEEELTNLKEEWELIQNKLQEAIEQERNQKEKKREIQRLQRRIESRERIEIAELRAQVAGRIELEQELARFWEILENVEDERKVLLLEYELLDKEWNKAKKQEILTQMSLGKEKVENKRRESELKAWDEWFVKEKQKKAFYQWKSLVKELKLKRKINELELEVKKLERMRKINLWGKTLKWTSRMTMPTTWASSVEIGIDAFEIRGESSNWGYELSWIMMGVIVVVGINKLNKLRKKKINERKPGPEGPGDLTITKS